MLKVATRDEVDGTNARAGHVSDLFFDSSAGTFSCIVRHAVGRLAMTTPIQLEPELRSVKVMASTIEGWLGPDEMEVLYRQAQAIQIGNVIVEIGSYCGKSTVVLGWGSRRGQGVKVYAIDPHEGSAEHAKYMKGSMGSYPYFQANIKRADLEAYVMPLVMTSRDAVAHVPEPVGLLFIDGDHDEPHVDLELWYDRVILGGKILFHDSIGGAWPVVESAVKDAVEQNLVQILASTGTMTVTEKV